MLTRITNIGSDFIDGLNVIAVNIEFQFFFCFKGICVEIYFPVEETQMRKRTSFSLNELLDHHTCRRLRKCSSYSL
jgi:hypothetical protein